MPPEAMQDSQATVFANLGIAVVAADPAQVSMLQTAESTGRRVLSVSPELVHHVLQDVLEYTRAYRDGVDDLAERVLHAADHDSMAAMAAAAAPPAVRGHDAVHLGHPGGGGELLAAVGPRHRRRRPRHRLRPRPTPTSPAAP